MKHLDRVAALVAPAPTTSPVMSAYAEDPAAFAAEVLGIRLWSHQRRALEAVRDHRRVAWRSCHGIGKSWAVAALAAWWIVTRAPALVIVTAPVHRQVKDIVWQGVRALHYRARVPLGGDLNETPEAGWRFPDGRLMVGFSAGDPDRLQGFHNANLLAIVDEASGVEAPIYEALKGALTGFNTRLLLTGNPVRPTGEFWEAFGEKKALYHTLHTSAFDSPNITLAEPLIEGIADPQWIEDMRKDLGEGSPAWRVRVLGEFPDAASNTIIPLADIEAANERYDEAHKAFDRSGALEIGVDVARFGEDDTVIVCRRGNVILPPQEYNGLDTTGVTARVLETARSLRRGRERVRIKVDAVGIGGGVVDQLRQHTDVDVVAVDASARSPTAAHARLRDSLWFGLRDWLKNGGCIPRMNKLAAELNTPTYTFDASSKIKVESKADIKAKLGGRSPDRADALALAVYQPFGGEFSSTYTAPSHMEREDGITDATLYWRRRIEEIETSGFTPHDEFEKEAA
jgi:hypothetical protein